MHILVSSVGQDRVATNKKGIRQCPQLEASTIDTDEATGVVRSFPVDHRRWASLICM